MKKMVFSENRQSDFVEVSDINKKTACNEAVFCIGAAEKKVRALHYSPASGRLINSPSILRRTFPALRFRTESYDEYKQLGDKLTTVFVNLYKCPYT